MIKNNIITDNLRGKRGSFLIRSNVTLVNNCYFLRWPEKERSVFGRDGMSLDQYNAMLSLDQESRNVVANPAFAGAVRGDDAQGDSQRPTYFNDAMLRQINDFSDAFATDPELIERGVGLDPDAFDGFQPKK